MKLKKISKKKNYNILTVDKNTVKDLWGLPYDHNEDEEVSVIEDKIIDTSRWAVHHNLIIKIKDKFYETNYSVGATEYQEERAWDDENTVEFVEVKPVEKVIISYEPVEIE